MIGGIVILFVVFGAGYWLALNPSDQDTTETESSEVVADNPPVSSDQSSGSDSPATTEEAIVIDTSSLSEGQRKMLETMGIDSNAITLTPVMITCAEAAIGAERLQAIKNGATPTFSEGFKLFNCYNK